jgi:lysophospholipase L1-like esterase
VEDTTGQDRGTAPYENGYISYAAITARHFDAEFSSISKSGIGVMLSWFPLIMPEMYDRLDPTDSSSKWDFSTYTPDLVVINLLQNDSWLIAKPDHAQFKARFGDKAPGPDQIIKAYRNLVQSIRAKYPAASIICALGSMDAARKEAPWFGYIEKAVGELNDTKIYTHSFGYKGTGGHPNAKEQSAMAEDLIRFIDQKIKW